MSSYNIAERRNIQSVDTKLDQERIYVELHLSDYYAGRNLIRFC